MNIIVEHVLEYRYSEPVWLDPTVVRLCPLSNSLQQVEAYQLDVIPEPVDSSFFVDAAGNNAQRLWFSGLHTNLKLTARISARTSLGNPFGFLLEPGADSIPFAYSEGEDRLLQPYTMSTTASAVRRLAQRAVDESSGQTVPFLVRLCEIIHQEVRLRRRPRGDPRRPEQTLLQKDGACRDLAVLFAHACRSVGIAARFVSGYAFQPELSVPELHAWCEVYLPGAGWRGFDPSSGLAIDSTYLALATGPTHDEARPACGSFRGSRGIEAQDPASH